MRILCCFLSFAGLLCLGAVARADGFGDAKREFDKFQRAETWQERAQGYDYLAAYDGAEAVEEILKALGSEGNGAVIRHALRTLGLFGSDEASEALAEAVRKGRGDRQYFALLALEMQRGPGASQALLEALSNKDTSVVAQAAIALGAKQVRDALAPLRDLLGHKEWQVRAAAARGLKNMAGPIPGPAAPGAAPAPFLPTWLAPDEVGPALIAALETSQEVDRRDLIAALERISGKSYGYDPAAWRQWLAATPEERIERNPIAVPRFFGIPVFGERVCVVIVNNVQLDKPHPYSQDRLKELCEVPGARAIPWIKIRTLKQFTQEHVARFLEDFAAGSRKVEIFTTGPKVNQSFGKLRVASASRKAMADLVEGLALAAQNDTYGALVAALDVSGSKDSVAWQKGPDEVLYVSCAPPWLAEVTDLDQAGAGIGLKARRRMVPVHSVGVAEHPGKLMKIMSEWSGGVYLTLER